MSLPDGPRALVERVDELTRAKIAPRAAHYDREGTNPVESWRDLWREGILGAAIPTAYGGLGLDMATYVAVERAIAGKVLAKLNAGFVKGKRVRARRIEGIVD